MGQVDSTEAAEIAVTNFERIAADLTASDTDIINALKDASKEDLSPVQRDVLQAAMQHRSQTSSMITSVLKSIHEMAMAIIRNFRVN